MINALFVLIVFLLQLNKDNIHVKWPFGVRTNITYDESTQEVIDQVTDRTNTIFCCLFYFFYPRFGNHD